MTQHRKAVTRRSIVGAAGAVTLAFAVSFGAAVAHADPNDPSMTEVTPNGQVRSEQSASVSSGDRCVANEGTMPTSDVRTSDQGVPEQTAEEAGPDWVGSRGWQAVAIDPSDPWGGNFDPANVPTGPACSPVSANHF